VNPGGDASGGAERSLALLMGGLVQRGHELAVITLLGGDAADAFSAAGATVMANGMGDGLDGALRHGSPLDFLSGAVRLVPAAMSTGQRIRALARTWEAQVIHTNGLRAHVLTPLLATVGQPVVWSLRERPPGRVGQCLIRVTSRRAAAITAPSSFAASLVARCRRPVYVIPNPVEKSVRPNSQAARRSLDLPLDRPIVGVVAHLHPTKGHHVAVEAWKHLSSPRPLLVLAGGDLYGKASTDYRESLRCDIRQVGLDNDVVLVGLVRDMASFYAACDLVVHPALYPEGFGRSMAEAQSAGVPVIATAIGGAIELIADGTSGMLVPPGDAPALARAVARVLGAPALYGRLREGGFVAAERYAPDACAAAVASVYQAVAK